MESTDRGPKPTQGPLYGQHGELDVISLGEDGREGGSGRNADIGNWQ